MTTTQQGQAGEDLACRYLEECGLQLVTRNYRCKPGELDLVMRDGEELVFVEVRSRRASRFGTAADSITDSKRRRLLRAAAHYLQRHRLDTPCRFDVIGLTRQGATWQIDWLRDAFSADGA